MLGVGEQWVSWGDILNVWASCSDMMVVVMSSCRGLGVDAWVLDGLDDILRENRWNWDEEQKP